MPAFDLDAYRVIVRPMTEDESGGNGGYLAEYPEVPYIIGAGDTEEEAIRCAREHLAMGLTTLMEMGHPIPKPKAMGA